LLFSTLSNFVGVNVGKKKASARVTKAEYEALAAFRYSLRQFLSFSESAAASAGVTPRQYQALLAIKGFPGRDSATIGELAEQLQIAHHSAVGLVDRLGAQNLVVRVAGNQDRREVYVALTVHGIELLDRLAKAHKDELRGLGPRLNAIVLALNRES
jgi:DNA-binding MarR family transcriptional regulator